jgi:hypothetical protein
MANSESGKADPKPGRPDPNISTQNHQFATIKSAKPAPKPDHLDPKNSPNDHKKLHNSPKNIARMRA